MVPSPRALWGEVVPSPRAVWGEVVPFPKAVWGEVVPFPGLCGAGFTILTGGHSGAHLMSDALCGPSLCPALLQWLLTAALPGRVH